MLDGNAGRASQLLVVILELTQLDNQPPSTLAGSCDHHVQAEVVKEMYQVQKPKLSFPLGAALTAWAWFLD